MGKINFPERKAFNFYKSYWETYKELKSDKEKIEFFEAICSTQFCEKYIDEIKIKNTSTKIAWVSVKHSIKSQISGFFNKYKIYYSEAIFKTTCQGGCEGGRQQGEEEEEGEEEGEEEMILKVKDFWNTFADKYGLSKIVSLTDKRKKAVMQRSKEKEFDFKLILEKISKSAYLQGKVKGWKVSFDWIFCSKNNYLKILEGNYDNGQSNSGVSRTSNGKVYGAR